MRNLLTMLLLLSVAGCEQYFQVDEACFEALSGAGSIPAASGAALARINCYRHLTGVARVVANDQVQIAADGVTNYVLLNPDGNELATDLGELHWLTQRLGDAGYTGVEVYERLTGTGAGQAGWTPFDPNATNIWEYIHIELADSVEALPSGADAVDLLMRDPVFRQVALQPSWIDGAYSELDLPPPWAQVTGDTAKTGTALTGSSPWARVYYLLVAYTAPHLEHVGTPVILPKDEQVGVPLYSWSEDQAVPLADGSHPAVQVSYPITLLMGAIDPANYSEVQTNQYDAQFTAAAIASEDGEFLVVEPVIPADAPEGVFPSGQLLRTTLALYASEAFLPATRYTVYAEYTSPEGTFDLEYSFLTASDDPGYDPDAGRLAPTQQSPTVASRVRRSWPLFSDFRASPAHP